MVHLVVVILLTSNLPLLIIRLASPACHLNLISSVSLFPSILSLGVRFGEMYILLHCPLCLKPFAIFRMSLFTFSPLSTTSIRHLLPTIYFPNLIALVTFIFCSSNSVCSILEGINILFDFITEGSFTLVWYIVYY